MLNSHVNENSNLTASDAGQAGELVLHPNELAYLGLDMFTQSAVSTAEEEPSTSAMPVVNRVEADVNKEEGTIFSCAACGFVANNRKQLWRYIVN